MGLTVRLAALRSSGALIAAGLLAWSATSRAQAPSAPGAPAGANPSDPSGAPTPPAAPGAPSAPSGAPPVPPSPAAATSAQAAQAPTEVVDPEPTASREQSAPFRVPAGREPPPPPAPPSANVGKFEFGSYGRIHAAIDGRGGVGRDADIVAHGSRLDDDNYVELEFRREDKWFLRGYDPVTTRIVSTIAFADPLFHNTGDFSARLAVRNLYLEERDIGYRGLAVWVGSRMYRGDDAYLLNWWPLDNLNTVGGGVRLNLPSRTELSLHVGTNSLNNSYFSQYALRPTANNQLGTTSVAILNRPKVIESARAEQVFLLNGRGGVKAVAYGELHQLPSGQREVEAGRYETLPSDNGYVAGLQLGAFTGERDTHINLFLRYSRGIAAFGGDLAVPTSLTLDRTTGKSHELSVAFSGNYEKGPFTVQAAGYIRSFRGASGDDFNYGNVDEGIVVVRPHVYFTDRVGVFVEGSYQHQQRGYIMPSSGKPLTASLARFGVVPFLSPAGKGSYIRPHLRLIMLFTRRDEGARSLYASDDVFARRQVEQYFGLSAEWWFNSSYR